MNTINSSTGFSGFQLHTGCSPHVILPLVPDRLLLNPDNNISEVCALIACLNDDTAEAINNLLAAKTAQAHFVNQHRRLNPAFTIGDCVMLSTFHHQRNYTAGHAGHAAK
ncbi:hypothetical protein ARMGADRAFT_872778, partial [Armillaria gallica]